MNPQNDAMQEINRQQQFKNNMRQGIGLNPYPNQQQIQQPSMLDNVRNMFMRFFGNRLQKEGVK